MLFALAARHRSWWLDLWGMRHEVSKFIRSLFIARPIQECKKIVSLWWCLCENELFMLNDTERLRYAKCVDGFVWMIKNPVLA
jgi:hypothetical protein